MGKYFLFLVSTFFFQCKSRPAEKRATMPFDDESGFFAGSFDRFSTSYQWAEAKYILSHSNSRGGIQEEGEFTRDQKSKKIKFAPKLFRCVDADSIKTLDTAAFQKIFDQQKDQILASYKANLDDPDGLKYLNERFSKAYSESEHRVLAQEISTELSKENVTKIGGYLDFLKELAKKIEDFRSEIDGLQEQVDRKQREADHVLQKMIDDPANMEALKSERLARVNERIEIESKILGIGETIRRYETKIKMLLKEYPLDEESLKTALKTLSNQEDYLAYAREYMDYVVGEQKRIKQLIAGNERIIQELKAFGESWQTPREEFYKINEIQFIVDEKAVNSSSPIYVKRTGVKDFPGYTTCSHGALLMMSNFLEQKARLIQYKE